MCYVFQDFYIEKSLFNVFVLMEANVHFQLLNQFCSQILQIFSTNLLSRFVLCIWRVVRGIALRENSSRNIFGAL